MTSAMPLQAFTFPFPETRFFRAGTFVYKFKIRGGSSFRGEEVLEGHCFEQELEEIIRTVLANLDSLQPFSSAHFNVFPYKKQWEEMCKHGEREPRAYPFSLVLYLEKNMQNEEAKEEAKEEAEKLSPAKAKGHRGDSPLEEAILKDLHKDMLAESKVPVGGSLSLHCPHAKTEVKEDNRHVNEKSAVNTIWGRGIPGEVHSGTIQHMGEEDGAAEGDSVPATPVRPWILTRLASHIFPVSWLLGDH